MKKNNDEVLAGKFAYTARSACKAAGVPGFDVLLGGALYILQSPTEVVMIFSGNAEARHIWLNVPHTTNPKPSWYGESVGHYEGGDTLVIDTVGLNDKTFIDNYRTPHTTQLHVIERWKLAPDAKSIVIAVYFEDPGAFTTQSIGLAPRFRPRVGIQAAHHLRSEVVLTHVEVHRPHVDRAVPILFPVERESFDE